MMGRGGPPPGVFGKGGVKSDLPFAGIPPEMLERTNVLADKEPDFSELTVPFSHRPPDEPTFTLWSFLGPYKFRMAGGLLLVGIAEMLGLIGPYLVKTAIDDAIIPGDLQVLLMVAVIWGASLVLAMLVNGFRTWYLGVLGQLLMYELRVRVFAHLQRLSLDFFTEEKAGRLMTRMTSDIEALSTLLQTGLINLVAQGLSLIFIVAILFSFNVPLTIVMLVKFG